MKQTIWYVVAGVLLLINACTSEGPKTAYEKLEQKELAKGTQVDSLFFGLSFGMTRNEFFEHCAILNKDSILYQGMGGKVEYKVRGDLKHNATMYFYPDFYENKIWRVPVSFNYDAWAPWNKHLDATHLRNDLINMFEKWYGGNKFMEVPHPTDTVAYVKIDGTRRILLERDQALMTVTATFTDLKEEQKIRKRREEEQKAKTETEE